VSHPDRDAQVEQIKQRIPTIADLFGDRPGTVPPLPAATFTDGAFLQAGFEDPRLVLFTGLSHGRQQPRIGWCLLGTAGNVEAGIPAVPRAAAAAVGNRNAVRAMQLLAVDQHETHEAAIEALKDPAAVSEIATLGDAAHVHGLGPVSK
jgi:hypothetical protein